MMGRIHFIMTWIKKKLYSETVAEQHKVTGFAIRHGAFLRKAEIKRRQWLHAETFTGFSKQDRKMRVSLEKI